MEDDDDLSEATLKRIFGKKIRYCTHGFRSRVKMLDRISKLEKALENSRPRTWSQCFAALLEYFPFVSSLVVSLISVYLLVAWFVESPWWALGAALVLALQPALPVVLAIAAVEGRYAYDVVSGTPEASPHSLAVAAAFMEGTFSTEVFFRASLLLSGLSAARAARIVWLNHGIRRAVHVYAVALFAIVTYVGAKVVVKLVLRLDESQIDTAYKYIDNFMAPLVANRFMALQSIW